MYPDDHDDFKRLRYNPALPFKVGRRVQLQRTPGEQHAGFVDLCRTTISLVEAAELGKL